MRSCRPVLPLIAIGLAAFLIPTPAMAFVTLSGKVTNVSGVGISGVQINFVDSCTGVTAAASGNVTSTTGTFTATVNPGIYDLEFVPPVGSLFAADRIRDFDLTASKSMAPLALPFGVTVSGHVTDAGGNPLVNVYLHFFPPGSSERIYTVRDKTDSSGNYSVVSPTGTYDLSYGPPSGTRFLSLMVPSVAIPGNITLPTVSMQSGLLVSGKVLDANSGTPVINVNIDAVDSLTGANLPLSHDRSDAGGLYAVAVPAGTYRFDAKPEKCTLLIAQESAATTVSADLTLPDVNLLPGVLVQGIVTDTRGTPVFDVNTNYIGSLGVRVFTHDDHADASGYYSAVVPPDIYSIEYIPPVGPRLAGVKNLSVDISGPITLPTVQLPDGFVFSAKVQNTSLIPLAKAQLDFFPTGTLVPIFTAHDQTDAAGFVSVVVVPGTYDVRVTPPSGMLLAAQRLLGTPLTADLSYGTITLAPAYPVSGQITDSFGSPVAGADLDFFDFYTGLKVETPNDNTDTNGNYSVLVPARRYKINVQPPPGVPLETARIADVTITSATSGLNAVLRSAALVSGVVRNPLSQPVSNVRLDFYVAGSDTLQSTTRDHTALDGTFGVYVPTGTYDLVFTPPSSAGLAPARLNGVVVSGDTSLGNIVLSQALAPSITSISPTSGPGSGGTAVIILGSNFQLGATAALGGLNLLSLQVVGPGQINAVTPGRQVGTINLVVDLTVTNVGAPPATLGSAFTYTPPASPLTLSLAPASPNVVLTWPSTGQAFYTVYRSTAPNLFGQSQLLAKTTSTSFIDVGALEDGLIYFYNVE